MNPKLLALSFLICVFQFACTGQKYSIGLNTSFQGFSNDFYLNYKAKEDPDLLVTYGDGSERNVVEQYEFSPLWSVIPTFTYTVRNPRRKGMKLEYSIGLGYAQTKFVISSPMTVAYTPEGGVVTSGDARRYDYSFGYMSVPLQAAKVFSNPRKPFFGSLGIEVVNFILLSKSATEQIYGQTKIEEVSTSRLVSARDYMVFLGFSPQAGVEFGRDKDFRISLIGKFGLIPFNIQKKEESAFDENKPYNGLKVEAYEEANSLNFYYGLSLSFSYQFD